MITQPKPLPTTNAPQEGFVLIVGLVILGLLTMLALSSMRDSTVQEKMAGASRDSGLAFQAAESALRDAENCITGATANCAFDAGEAAHFAKDDAAFPEHNTLFNAATWGAFDPPGDPTALDGVPAGGANYIIREVVPAGGGPARAGAGEDLGTASKAEKTTDTKSHATYEITARGASRSDVGQSVLRTYYRK